jgi:precorrin-3B methylase
MEFSDYTTDELSAAIHDAQGTAFAKSIPAMKAELKDRKAAAIMIENMADTRELATKQYAMLQAVTASKVAEVSSADGTAYRRNFSALVSLVEDGWSMPTLKARHAVTALVDTSAVTKDVTDLESAVNFAAENTKSDVYSS